MIMNEMCIAKVCHEANKAFCEGVGDMTQKSWDEAMDWQRESAVNGVIWAMDNPDAKPSAQHDAWMADKLISGWTYGPVKDAELKQHPCLVPYEQLPREQQLKDALFRAIVQSLTK